MFRLDWAEKLAVVLAYLPPEQKLVLVETKEGATIRLRVDKVDALACSFTELRIEEKQVNEREINTQAWADEVVNRVSYLLEPLRVIEVDHRGMVQLHSDPPEKRDEAIVYYDVILSARHGQSVSLDFRRKRYSRSEQEIPLSVVPCVLTLDILKRLVSDFEAAWPNRPVAAERGSSEQWNPLA